MESQRAREGGVALTVYVTKNYLASHEDVPDAGRDMLYLYFRSLD